MAAVLQFPRHARASAAALNPKTERSACLPRRESSSEKVMKYSGGIKPRAFQLETAGKPTPVRVAAADVPPTASMTSSTELSIAPDTSRLMKLSRLHDTAIDSFQAVNFNHGMPDSRAQIVFRLRLLHEVLEKDKNVLAAVAGVTGPAWSNWISETSKNIIPWESASDLCDAYGLTLDWIYRGHLPSIPDPELRLKIQKAERAAKAALAKGRVA